MPRKPDDLIFPWEPKDALGGDLSPAMHFMSVERQRDRLSLDTTEVQPTKRAHAKMLKKHGKLNTFVKCLGCKQRGGMYYLHVPTATTTRWCYYCWYKD